ncbi:MAG: lipocalin family protein [Bacteroidota bacterium]|nr:lipocalin family protein [Bacteroidota bacterium]
MKKQILIAIAVLGTVVACKKEESSKVNETPITETQAQKIKKVLTSQTWKIEGMFIGSANGPMLPLPMDSCEKDDYVKFTSDNKQIFYAGATKCDPEETDSTTNTYRISEKGDSLSVVFYKESLNYGITNTASGKIELVSIENGTRFKMVMGKF